MIKILEVRPAEGGKDSKLFAEDLLEAYIKTCQKMGWKVECL